MPQIRFSNRAEADLDDILAWTTKHFGPRQADSYMDGLDVAFDRLARNPNLGRFVPQSRFHWRRMEHVSHIILFRILDDGIIIERVVHQRRLMSRITR